MRGHINFNDKKLQTTTLLVAAAVVLYVVMLILGLGKIRQVMEQDTKEQLKQLTVQGQDVITGRFEAEYQLITEYADIIGKNGELLSEQNQRFVQQLQQEKKAVTFVLSNLDGSSYSSTGETGNLGSESVFQRILKSDGPYYGLETFPMGKVAEPSLVIAAPVMKNGAIAGILTACYGIENHESIVGAMKFVNDSQTYILDKQGKALFQSTIKDAPFGKNAEQKFSDEKLVSENVALKQLREDMKQDKEGIIKFSDSSQSKTSYISYAPVGINDWYLAEEVSYRALTEKNGLIQQIIVAMTAATVVIILIFGYSLYQFKRKSKKEQEQLVMHDEITGLPNRRYLLQFYNEIAAREGDFVYLLFHVNFFKRTNSLFGYETGSHLLKDIGALLASQVKEEECAARISNDFFGLILKNEETEALRVRVDNLFKQLGSLNIKDKFIVYDYKCYFTGGLCVLDNKEANLEDMNSCSFKVITDLGELEQNQWAVYDEQRKAEQQQEHELAGDIIHALQEKQFVPYFQPQYNMESREVTGAEILARWQHPQRGILTPDKFLHLLEEAGCILELDIIMLEEACSQIKAWLNEGLLPVPLSLNFSMLNLHRKDFVERVSKIVGKYDVSPNLISLEFKNSAVFDNLEKAVPVFGELKGMGFKLAIDGFGTGDSSFRVMEEVEVRTLKLDRSFVAHITENEKSQILIRHIISMAKEMGVIIIAEGVEQSAQLDFLQAGGCRFAQGFLFGKPCSIAEFEALIFS